MTWLLVGCACPTPLPPALTLSVRVCLSLCLPACLPSSLQVFSYKPSGYDPITSNMVVVLHGAQRNARDYRDYSRDLADRTGALVIAPHFDKEK